MHKTLIRHSGQCEALIRNPCLGATERSVGALGDFQEWIPAFAGMTVGVVGGVSAGMRNDP
jgi:hypothetical protein